MVGAEQEEEQEQEQEQEEEDGAAGRAAGERVLGALVFQCLNCKAIVGDSLSLTHRDEAAQTITLRSAHNVSRVDEVFSSSSGRDIGCTFFLFACVGCGAELGKFYITTSKGMDQCRERFNFSVSALSSYELGSASQATGAGKDPAAVAGAGATATSGGGAAAAGHAPAATRALVEKAMQSVDERFESMTTEVLKIEHVMLGLSERVQTLEQTLIASSASQDEDDDREDEGDTEGSRRVAHANGEKDQQQQKHLRQQKQQHDDSGTRRKRARVHSRSTAHR